MGAFINILSFLNISNGKKRCAAVDFKTKIGYNISCIFIFLQKRFFMLSSLFRGGFSTSALVELLLLIPIILFSLSAHEFAHGYTAFMLGDETARNYGRLTLNPLKHIDPLGFLMLLFAGFGWAKPVPVSTRHMKNSRWGFVLVSLAGPFTNLVIATVSAFLYFSSIVVQYHLVANGFDGKQILTICSLVQSFFALSVSLNVGYAVFNMIPIPPLDGSRLLTACMPRKAAIWFFKYEHIIQLVLFALIILDVLNGPISYAIRFVIGLIESFVGLFPFEFFLPR